MHISNSLHSSWDMYIYKAKIYKTIAKKYFNSIVTKYIKQICSHNFKVVFTVVLHDWLCFFVELSPTKIRKKCKQNLWMVSHQNIPPCLLLFSPTLWRKCFTLPIYFIILLLKVSNVIKCQQFPFTWACLFIRCLANELKCNQKVD